MRLTDIRPALRTLPRRLRPRTGTAPSARALRRGLALFALYLALAGSLSVPELMAAAGSAGLGLAFLALLRRQSRQQYGGEVAWFGELPRIAAGAARGTAATAVAIGRAVATGGRAAPRGRQVELPFAPGSDARTAMRRALATLALSVAPDTYVMFADRQRHRLLVHALLPERAPSARTGAELWPP